MLTRIISLSLCMMFSFNTFASSVKTALQDFTYTMEVEGAALDPKLKNEAITKLHQDLDSLKAKGLTDEAILQEALNGIKNAEAKKNLQLELNRFDLNHLSQEDSQYLLTQVMNQSQMKGASWVGESGKTIFIVAGGIALLVGLLYVLVRYDSCPTNYPDDVCANWDTRFDD